MLFPSLTFLFCFLPVVLAAYYLLCGHRKAQNRLLLVASLVFYAWGEPAFVFVMMAMVVVDWALALGMQRSSRSGGGVALL